MSNTCKEVIVVFTARNLMPYSRKKYIFVPNKKLSIYIYQSIEINLFHYIIEAWKNLSQLSTVAHGNISCNKATSNE